MTNIATLFAAATLSLSALAASPALAAAPADLDPTADVVVAPADATTVDVAYYCDYVIVWDAWGNYYYEYVCY